MYIDYSKLWKFLVDKSMSKTDLMEITGISSRVLAKLSKNETVTTDTIARICSALNCDVSDIMECVGEERLSVYSAYKKYGTCAEENELFRTVQFAIGGQKFTVYESKQIWEHLFAIGTVATTSEKHLLIKPCPSNDEIPIVLIKGKPAVIIGLDENGFVSSRGIRKKQSDVYVMSEAAFKLFVPQAF